MKSKKLFVHIVLFLSLNLVLLLGPICEAQQTAISIESATAQLIQTRPPVGNKIIYEYRITTILRNSGDRASPNIDVKFREPEPGTNSSLIFQPRNCSLQPGEEKTFVFTNWPTTLTGDIPLNISFTPTSPDVLLSSIVASNNSNYYIYTLHNGDTNPKTSTPGFEVLIVLLAVLSLVISKKLKK